MERIIARQNSAAKPATGKTFVLGIARIILELAVVQIAVNILIRVTGIGLFNLVFYLYAVVLLVRFMTRTVAGSIYTLKEETLELQRLLGDSTVLGVSIKRSDIISIRPIVCGERLALDYRQVTYVDSVCAPGLRMHAAFIVSLIWAWLARVIAGKKARRANGYVVVYMEDKKRCACAFRPDAAFVKALKEAHPEEFGRDERLECGKLVTYYAKSLRRTFGDLYPHVPDEVSEEELIFEREEFARREDSRIEWIAGKLKIKPAKLKKVVTRINNFIPACMAKFRRLLAAAAGKVPFLAPMKSKLGAFAERVRREEELEEMLESVQEDAQQDTTQEEQRDVPRRRRGRQE